MLGERRNAHAICQQLVEYGQPGTRLGGDQSDSRCRRGGQPGPAEHAQGIDELLVRIDHHRTGFRQQRARCPPRRRQCPGVRLRERGYVTTPGHGGDDRFVRADGPNRRQQGLAVVDGFDVQRDRRDRRIVAEKLSTSIFVTSTQLPRPTPSPTPTPDSDSRNDNAWFIPPLAATTATGPAAMCSTVGTKLTVAPVGRKKPEVFGPSSRIPVVELISASCSCRATPSAPTSANPPEQMTAAPTPQSAASRTASGVAAAGTHNTARSSARPWTSVAACNEGRNDPSCGFGVDAKDRSGVAAASGDGVEHHRSELARRGRRSDDGDRGGVEEPVES